MKLVISKFTFLDSQVGNYFSLNSAVRKLRCIYCTTSSLYALVFF